jgi:predicted dehydrogenase
LGIVLIISRLVNVFHSFYHSRDLTHLVLGYGFETAKSVLANRRPIVKLLNNDDEKKVLDAEHKKTSDDTIFFTGTLSNGIPLSYSLRGGKAFKGAGALDWRIYGEKGELRITGSGPFIQIGYPDLKVELHDFESDEVTEIKVDEDLEKFIFPARNVARVYKELRAGKNNCSFEDAVERHRLIAGLYKENGIEN